ncbi:MAG: insulinase family protein [Cyclobacteriaceae bacterium]
MLDRTIAPPSGAITNPNLKHPEKISFNKGSDLYCINAGDQHVLKFEILLKSAIWNEKREGLSWITSKLLPEGSASKSSHEIAGLFEFYGSFLEINPGFDNTSIVVYSPVKHFEKVVSLLSEILYNPAFEQKEIDLLKTNKIQHLKVNLEKNSFLASRKIREALFGTDHPYGKSISQSEVVALEKNKIEKYYKESFYNDPVFFLSGLVGDEEIKLVEKYYSQAPIVGTSDSSRKQSTGGTKNIYVEKEESVQSSIRMAWPIPDKKHLDHYQLVLLNEILGGYFSSRLMKNLREDKGYTYGVHSYPIFLQHASFLVVSADVIAESTEDALNEIHKELDLLKHELISQEELETVRNYMAGSFLSSVSTPFQLMEKFKGIFNHGLTYEYYNKFFESLLTTTPENLLQIANQYLNLDDVHYAIVGKK